MKQSVTLLAILLAVIIVPIAQAEITVTCDANTYKGVSEFEAYCEVGDTGAMDITLQLPSQIQYIANPEMQILKSVAEYYKVNDYAWIWKNATCNNETWVNQNTTISLI